MKNLSPNNSHEEDLSTFFTPDAESLPCDKNPGTLRYHRPAELIRDTIENYDPNNPEHQNIPEISLSPEGEIQIEGKKFDQYPSQKPKKVIKVKSLNGNPFKAVVSEELLGQLGDQNTVTLRFQPTIYMGGEVHPLNISQFGTGHQGNTPDALEGSYQFGDTPDSVIQNLKLAVRLSQELKG